MNMAASLHELLQPQVILDVITRIRPGRGRLSPWLGFQPDRFDPATVSLSGPNTVQGDTRYATFRIFDETRVVAKARAPGTGPATVAVNPVGDVRVSCARYHEKCPLSYEELGNLSPIVGPNSVIDPGGQDYLQRQTRFIAVQFNNAVELMATAMIQDNLYFQQQGDNWIPAVGNPGGVSFQVPFQVPAGNKNQLNMLGAGNIINVPWNNVGAPIYSNISQIKMAFAQLSGWPLNHVWLNSGTWYNVITNTEIRNLAGSSNTPFAEFDNVDERGVDGHPTGEYAAVLRADPTIQWHITDHVLVGGNTDIDPTYSTAPSAATLFKVVPDNKAFFLPEPDPMWTKMYHGGEYVVENPGMPGSLRRGYYFWREYTTQPSGVDLIGLLNCVPLLYNPRVVAAGTVNF
jgi:hypothetical protein